MLAIKIFFLISIWHDDILSPFQLQITASVHERPLRATRATTAAPRRPAEAVREPKTFVAQ